MCEEGDVKWDSKALSQKCRGWHEVLAVLVVECFFSDTYDDKVTFHCTKVIFIRLSLFAPCELTFLHDIFQGAFLSKSDLICFLHILIITCRLLCKIGDQDPPQYINVSMTKGVVSTLFSRHNFLI